MVRTNECWMLRRIGPSGVCPYCNCILYGDAGHSDKCAELRKRYAELDKEVLFTEPFDEEKK
jgi:hypothetical protein